MNHFLVKTNLIVIIDIQRPKQLLVCAATYLRCSTRLGSFRLVFVPILIADVVVVVVLKCSSAQFRFGGIYCNRDFVWPHTNALNRSKSRVAVDK